MAFPLLLSRYRNLERLAGGGGWTPTFLLLDKFTTDAAAPLTTPRTCEPGPGTLTIVDTGNKLSIVSSELEIDTSTLAGADPRLYGSSTFARATGRAVVFWVDPSGAANGNSIGWHTTNNFAPTYLSTLLREDVEYAWINTALVNTKIGSLGPRYCAIVLRSAGAFFALKTSGAWELGWVDGSLSTSPLYAGMGNHSSAAANSYVDNFGVLDLIAPWNDDYGIATQRLAGARSPGDTFTHEANCLIEFTVTTRPSADQIEVRFRVQDATNYWQVTVDSTGALDLDEVVAGTPTQRGTSAGVIVNGDRIVIMAEGTTITVYEANNERIAYTSASNFQTETDGKLETEGTGGSVSDIIAWPRTLSGAANSVLNAAVNF